MASATEAAVRISREFESRCRAVKVTKKQINMLIMDYLVSEGYPRAAQDFAREANLQPSGNVDSLQSRKEIKLAIYAGRLAEAIAMINELNPQILEHNQKLHFSLLRLQLIELIKRCNNSAEKDIMPAINFATENLAPIAPTNPTYLNDFEQTMALLVFDPEKLTPPLAAILDPQLRVNVARDVNEALLQASGEPCVARLNELLKTRVWAESEGRRLQKPIPSTIDIGLDLPNEEVSRASAGTMSGNGLLSQQSEDQQMED